MELKKITLRMVLFLLIVVFAQSVAAEHLCYFKGPDVSEHNMVLTEFVVSGPSSINDGDTLSVEFKLKNAGKSAVVLGKRGVFVYATDPAGRDSSFGYTQPGKTVFAGQTISVSSSIRVEELGDWSFWPSYSISTQTSYLRGPEGWHICQLTVQSQILDAESDSAQFLQTPPSQEPAEESDPLSMPLQSDAPYYIDTSESDASEDVEEDEAVEDRIADSFEREKTDFRSPTIRTVQSPKKPAPGDRVSFRVTADDAEGVAAIQVWVNGLRAKTCFSKTCNYISPDGSSIPEFGAVAIDTSGNIAIVGGGIPTDVDEITGDHFGSWSGDRDEDGIFDILDNCVDEYNPEQGDLDSDGVGNACDACSIIDVCDSSYCCDYTNPYSPCRDLRRMDTTFSRDVYYWEDYYTAISDDGCGCYDSDSGLDPYTRGQVNSEVMDTTRSSARMRGSGTGSGGTHSGCSTTSNCERQGIDTCIVKDLTNRSLIEHFCGPNGAETRVVTCPDGCLGGKCLCSDTDGGRKYYTRGTMGSGNYDRCIEDGTYYGTLREYFCGWDSEAEEFSVENEIVFCPYGCIDGACLCSDTDGGRNFEVKGRVSNKIDHCEEDNRTLIEYYTDWTIGSEDCVLLNDSHLCEGLCFNGTCRAASCYDGIMDGDEEDIDCGGSCEPCDYCSGDLPEVFDWRDFRGRNWMTPIKNQGDCGSCWAHAAIGATETMYNLENTPVGEPIDTNNWLNLSEQYLVSNCFGTGSCSGGGSYSALVRIRDWGIPDEECFPYEARTTHCRPCTDWTADFGWTISGFRRAKRLGESDDDLKRHIACDGPVTTCGGGHCVLIIGWRDVSPSGWIIKNSWGTDWGTHGYGVLEWDHEWMGLDTQKYYVFGVGRY